MIHNALSPVCKSEWPLGKPALHMSYSLDNLQRHYEREEKNMFLDLWHNIENLLCNTESHERFSESSLLWSH